MGFRRVYSNLSQPVLLKAVCGNGCGRNQPSDAWKYRNDTGWRITSRGMCCPKCAEIVPSLAEVVASSLEKHDAQPHN